MRSAITPSRRTSSSTRLSWSRSSQSRHDARELHELRRPGDRQVLQRLRPERRIPSTFTVGPPWRSRRGVYARGFASLAHAGSAAHPSRILDATIPGRGAAQAIYRHSGCTWSSNKLRQPFLGACIKSQADNGRELREHFIRNALFCLPDCIARNRCKDSSRGPAGDSLNPSVRVGRRLELLVEWRPVRHGRQL